MEKLKGASELGLAIIFAFVILGAAFLIGSEHAHASPSASYYSYSDVMLLVNNASETSKSIYLYYNPRREGLKVCFLDTSTPTSEIITFAQFNDTIRPQIETCLNNFGIYNVNYIVTTKGCPLRINNDTNMGSFDQKVMLILGNYTIQINYKRMSNPYYNDRETFSSRKYGFYLVTRLDGYTRSDIYNLIDNSKKASKVGQYVLDVAPNKDTSQGFSGWNDLLRQANTTLKGKGITSIEMNENSTFVTGRTGVIGYASWGSNDACIGCAADSSTWNFGFNPGAIAETAVSTSARSFATGTTYGQSLIADLIADNVTGVKGYVYEPGLSAIAEPDILFERYMSGFNLADSFFMASMLFNWMDVVVGDPKTLIDTEKVMPAIVLDAPLDGERINASTLINFTVTDNMEVDTVKYQINGNSNTTLVSPYNISTTGWADGERTLTVWANDTSGNLDHRTYTFSIGNTSGYAPKYTKFGGATTNIKNETNKTFVYNLTLEIAGSGKIEYGNQPINVSSADLDAYVTMSNSFIDINSFALPHLNASANITFYELSYNQSPVLVQNGTRVCQECWLWSYSGGAAMFNVSNFSNYTAMSNSNLSIWTETDAGYKYGGRVINVSQNLTVFANYTNTTDSTYVSSANSNCTVWFRGNGYNMVWNATDNVYTMVMNFSSGRRQDYNVQCNSTAEYENISASDQTLIGTCGAPTIQNNWTITGTEECNDETVVMWDGQNILIQPGANLTLNHATIIMNITASGNSNITVNGGNLTIMNLSNITTNESTVHSAIIIQPNSNFSMTDSFISEMGWDDDINIRGFELNSPTLNFNNNTITNNYIGIYLYGGANGSIMSNTNSSRNSQYGIYLSSSNNTLTNLTASHHSEAGIYISYGSNNTIYNATSNSNDYGVYLSSSSNNTLANISARSNIRGIRLDSSSSNTITNTDTNNNNNGIFLDSSSNNTLSNTNSSYNSVNGIRIDSSSNNTLSGFTANSNSNAGIYLSSSSNNTLANINIWNCITTTSGCIYISTSTNNSFIKGTVNLTQKFLVDMRDSNNTLFQDVQFINNTDGQATPLYGGINITSTNANRKSTENTFLNCSFTGVTEATSANSQLIRQWYLDTYVNYTNASAAANANISVWNSTGMLLNYTAANSTGWHPFRLNITQYINQSGSTVYANNHTVYANLSGFVNASASWAIGNGTSGTYGDGTWGDWEGNNTRITLTLAAINSSCDSTACYSSASNTINITGPTNCSGLYATIGNTAIVSTCTSPFASNCISVAANINVTDNGVGGNLTLNGCELRMNRTGADGASNTVITNWGNFTVVSSNITTNDSAKHSAIIIKANSNFSMVDSFVSEMGWAANNPNQRGLEFNSPVLLFQNNTLTKNHNGVTLYNTAKGSVLTNINASSNSNYGIILYSHSNNNTFTGITASSNRYAGIYLYDNSNNILTNITANSNTDYGINLDSSSSNTLTNINTSSNYFGIFLLSSSNGNTLASITASSNSRGIYLVSSSSNIITNITASSNSLYGIYLYTSSNNIFRQASISNSSNALVDIYSSYGNTFIDAIMQNTKAISVQQTRAKDTCANNNGGLAACSDVTEETTCSGVSDCWWENDACVGDLYSSCTDLYPPNSCDLYTSSKCKGVFTDSWIYTNTFLNATYENESVGGAALGGDNTTLTRQWYLDTYANYTNTSTTAGINISVFNSTGAAINYSLTNATGWHPFRLNITQYQNASGTTTNANNHTVYANLSGFVNASISWAIGNGTSGTYGDGAWGDIGNNTKITLTLDNVTAPFVYMYSPNASYYNTTQLNMLYIASSTSLDKVWYQYNSANNTLTGNVSISGVDGSNSMVLWANNTNNEQNHTVPFTVNVDTRPPNTTIDNTSGRTIPYSSGITIQGTCIDSGIAGLHSAYTNSTNFTSVNGSFNGIASGYFNLSNTSAIPDGLNTVYVFCNDSYGNNLNFSKLTFTLDTVPPVLTIATNLNGTYRNDTMVGVSGECEYAGYGYVYTNSTLFTPVVNVLDLVTTGFIFTNTSASQLASSMAYSIMIYCNDTVNNTASDFVTFVYDNTKPKPVLFSPNASKYNTTTFNLLEIAVDETQKNATWYQYNGINTSIANGANATPSTVDGSNSILLWVNDSAGNYNFTAFTVDADLSPPATTIDNTTSAKPYSQNIWIQGVCSGDHLDSAYTDSPYFAVPDSSVTTSFNISNSTNTPDGTHEVTVSCNDTYGNNANPDSLTFTLDTKKPSVSISPNLNGTYRNDTTVTVAGACSDTGTPSSAYTNSTLFTPTVDASPASFSFTNTSASQLASGTTYSIMVYCNDTANNTASDFVTFIYDNTKPRSAIISPNASHNNLNTTTFYLQEIAADETQLNHTWYQYGSNANASLANGDNATANKLEGSNTLRLWVNDSAGNYNLTSFIVNVDTQPPNTTIDNATSTIPYSPLIAIQGTCSDDGIADLDSAYTNSSYFATPDTTITTSFNLTNTSGIPEGLTTVYVFCNDSYGNNLNFSRITFTLDSVMPAITIDLPKDGYYNSSQAVSGVCDGSNAYTNHSAYPGVDDNPTPSFNITNTSGIADGRLGIRVYCNDTANNTAYGDAFYWLDTTKPYWWKNLTNASSSSTRRGDTVYFNVTWNDAIRGNYSIFSWNDGGSWANETLVIGSTSNESSVIRVVTSALGAQVSWRWYANDSANNWNVSDVYSFMVYSMVPVVNAVNATPGIQGFGQNATIWANVTDADGQSDISKVWAQVTTPLGAVSNLTLDNAGTYLWKGNYTSGFTNGTYNIIIWANDSSNLYAATNATSFQSWINPVVTLYANQTAYNPSENVSLINSNVTNGATEASAYLLMKVQYWTGTAWTDETAIKDDTTARYLAPNAVLDTAAIWNATSWNVSTRTHGDGTYRAYLALTDASNNVVSNRSGSSLEFGYNFSTYNPAPNITLVRTYKSGEEASKFMPGETVDVRANVTDINGRTDITGVLASIIRPTGVYNLTNATMAAIELITNGSVYSNSSYALPSDAQEGTWTVRVYAYDKEGLYATSTTTFAVIAGHSIQLALEVPGASGLVAMGTSEETAASSMSNTTNAAPSHHYITTSGNGTVKALVFVEKTPISIGFGRSGSAAHTISLDQYLTGASDLLVFTKGGAEDVDNRIADIESGSFFNQISPSFSFGLGLRYPLKVMAGYTNINVTGDMELNTGYHTIVVENAGTSGGKRVVNIRQA